MSFNDTITPFLDLLMPLLKAFLVYSFPISVVSFIIGILIAFVIGLVRFIPQPPFPLKVLELIFRFYVSIMRGTPMLVQLFILFYGLPSFGIQIDPIPSAIIAFSLNIGAYSSEIFRSGVEAVDKGQWEASLSLGMTYTQTFRHVILPQAVKVSIPGFSNSFISMIKDSSLASVVMVPEMFRQAQIIAASTYNFLYIYSVAALIYWVVCILFYHLQKRLENHFARHLR